MNRARLSPSASNLLLVLSLAALVTVEGAACVGDNPVPLAQPEADAGATTSSGGSSSGETPPTEAGTPDAPLACDAPLTVCGDTCVDLSSSAESCGRCGHDCGGGACVDSVCRAVKLVDDLPKMASVAADADGFVYNDSSTVHGCAAAGCDASGGIVLATFSAYPMGPGLALAAGRVFLHASRENLTVKDNHLYHCARSGCTDPMRSLVSGVGVTVARMKVGGTARDRVFYGYERSGSPSFGWSKCTSDECSTSSEPVGTAPADASPFLVSGDDSYLYLASSTTAATTVYACPLAGCPTPTVHATSDATGGYQPISLDALGGRVYLAESNGASGRVRSCAVDAANTCTTLQDGIPGMQAFAIDEAGLYIGGAGTSRALLACAPTGCGSSTTLYERAEAVTYASIQPTSKFIYWIEETTARVRTLWRVARP